MSLYVPFRAVIHLFTYILRSPEAKTAQSDLVLMEVAAGYASRLEFAVDGSLSLPIVKDFIRFARAVVDRAKTQGAEGVQGGAVQSPNEIQAQGADLTTHQQISTGDGNYFPEVRNVRGSRLSSLCTVSFLEHS